MHECLPPEPRSASLLTPSGQVVRAPALSALRHMSAQRLSSLQMVTCAPHCSLKAVCGHLLLSHGCLSSQAPRGWSAGPVHRWFRFLVGRAGFVGPGMLCVYMHVCLSLLRFWERENTQEKNRWAPELLVGLEK